MIENSTLHSYIKSHNQYNHNHTVIIYKVSHEQLQAQNRARQHCPNTNQPCFGVSVQHNNKPNVPTPVQETAPIFCFTLVFSSKSNLIYFQIPLEDSEVLECPGKSFNLQSLFCLFCFCLKNRNKFCLSLFLVQFN